MHSRQDTITTDTIDQAKGNNDTTQFSIKTYQTDNNQWGYDIYKGGKLVIHQPVIPVIEGLYGFKNKTDAVKCAELVIDKLKQNIMPPTLTLEELQDLKISLR